MPHDLDVPRILGKSGYKVINKLWYAQAQVFVLVNENVIQHQMLKIFHRVFSISEWMVIDLYREVDRFWSIICGKIVLFCLISDSNEFE